MYPDTSLLGFCFVGQGTQLCVLLFSWFPAVAQHRSMSQLYEDEDEVEHSCITCLRRWKWTGEHLWVHVPLCLPDSLQFDVNYLFLFSECFTLTVVNDL